jgi:hypothetical protein
MYFKTHNTAKTFIIKVTMYVMHHITRRGQLSGIVLGYGLDDWGV